MSGPWWWTTRVVVTSIGLVAVAGLWFFAHEPVFAAENVTFSARIDGRSLTGSSRHSVPIHPSRPVQLELTITNNSEQTMDVRSVQTAGKVIGLTFFSYETEVAMAVEPGTTTTRRLSLRLDSIKGQATGLLWARVALLDEHRKTLASESGVVDVRGSLRSVYGLFGLTVAIVTTFLFVKAALDVLRHRQEANRWRRAIRFVPIGIGVGLVVIFSLSAFRAFVSGGGQWVPILLLSTAAAFVLGYSTPKPTQPRAGTAVAP